MTDSARAKAVDRYTAARPDLAHQLAFFSKLWDIQDEAASGAAEYAPAGDEPIARALRQHQTLFSLAAPTIPLEAYRVTVRALASLIAAEAGLPAAPSAALAELDLGEAITAEVLEGALTGIDAFVSTVTAAVDDSRLSEPVVGFILTEAMTPYVRAAAKTAVKAAGAFDWLLWDSGLCPVCGTPASSGAIRDEGELQGGRRWLSCPLCRTQWEYARVRCARCGSRQQTTLEYLYDQADPAHRMHTCDACHGYTPVTVERDLNGIAIPEVEEIVMVPLETVASERGYTPLGDEVTETAN